MKTLILPVVATAIMAMGLVGCGIGTDGNDQMKAQQQRDAKVLEERFQTVRGTYEGNLENPASGLGPLRAKLTLYVVNVRETANPDGSVRIRPALYGRFQPPPEVRKAWEQHGQHDSYSTVRQMRALAEEILPGATVRRCLLWRYLLVYRKT